ncbi:MAG: M20/M25/M40 family metallo-hydrolase [Myxococcales bacterium]|jgi:acetylornithine deacetylase/succinyl-diaminopimelate desuccinylase-like protein
MQLTAQAEAEALALLADLLKADTTNPPGNERACAEVLAESLRKDGYEPQLVEKAPGRTNLVVRRQGDGTGGGPLLLTGHLDVAPADAAEWKHPPFGAETEEGWLYGRGALDMKGHLAACAMVLKQLARDDVKLKRDVIFAAVADGRTGCDLGARFLVDEHPELVRADWAIGAGGGLPFELEGKRLYPIQVAHKGATWISMKARGPLGQGSIPRSDSAVLKLALAIARIGNQQLPLHVAASTRQMLRAIGQELGSSARFLLSMVGRPSLTDFALENAVPEPALRRSLQAVLRNTATPTVLRAGEATNVLPSTAEARLDGRILPGQSTANLLCELKEIVNDADITFTVMKELSPVEAPIDSPLYERLAAAVKELDPQGAPIPFVGHSFTDASAFCRLGMRFYGFTPVRFPEKAGIDITELPHLANERIPIDGFKAGVRALFGVVAGFCGG